MMGKWQRNFNKVEFQPGHSWYSFAVDMECAQHIVAAHNADIDALTAERDEARAQLAQWRSDFSKAMERAKQAETQRDAIIAMLEPTENEDRAREFSNAACDKFYLKQSLHARAVAIREGREA